MQRYFVRASGAAIGLLPGLLAVVLPAALLWTSWTTYRMQVQQQGHYLRGRMGALAAWLETMPEAETGEAFEMLSAEEPSLTGLEVIRERRAGDGLDALWEGRQLFLLEGPAPPEGRLMRGWIPFHCGSGLCLARIELSAEAADFIVEPARRNLAVSAAASLALVVLSLWMWRAFLARQKALLREAELEHLAGIGRLSAVLAHEIRNPLGTIKGFAQLIEEHLPEAQKKLATPIVSEAVRLERLVNDLLAYGRPRNPEPAPVRLKPLLEQMLAEQREAEAGAETDWRLEADTPEIEMLTDEGLLRQVMGNLLRNAGEAARESAAPGVRVSVGVEGEDVRIEVSDNGPGFPEEALKRAFEPFFTTKSTGTGLGLAISRRIAATLGGEVEVRNGEQGGAVATLRLPRGGARQISDREPGHRIHS